MLFAPVECSDRLIATEIILGSPGSQCLGHGICMVLEMGTDRLPTCPTLPAIFHIAAPHQLQLWISQDAISDKMRNKHFSGQFFHMEEPIVLPGFLCEALQLNISSQIPSGQHALQKLDAFMLITLPIGCSQPG
ncbi:MAG TPA: hypothetical protein VK168_06360 [Saprospiraceae bacterium]|nr:hypothetical protein [Saprospiraceae bacterium]